MDYAELVARLRTGHDKECAMSYGMHEHCCDCSYPIRQEAADAITSLQAERDTARAARDYAMEMVNVQDNKIDALRALLKTHGIEYDAE